MKLTIEKFASVVVTTNSTWTFAVISDGEGNSTTVEVTAGDNSRAVAGTLADLVSELRDEAVGDESDVEGLLELSSDALRRDRVLGDCGQRAADSGNSAWRDEGGRRPDGVPRRRACGERSAVCEHQSLAVRHGPDARGLPPRGGESGQGGIHGVQVRSVRRGPRPPSTPGQSWKRRRPDLREWPPSGTLSARTRLCWWTATAVSRGTPRR